MNRNEQSLKDIAADAKQASDGLMVQIKVANENLSSLTVRLDRILMALTFIGGSNLLLGNDLAGKVQRSTSKTDESRNVEVRSWDLPYYERLD